LKRPQRHTEDDPLATEVGAVIFSADVASAFKDIAEALAAYYTALKKQGFSEQQAMQLVAAYQAQVLAAGMNKKS